MDKIQKFSLVDEAYKRIKTYLLNGNFSEGQKIPSENQLCKELSVSRVVIREALTKLRSEKIIVTYQGKGSFLANPVNFYSSIENFDDKIDYEQYVKIMEFREAIEFFAINYAVQYASDQELSKLKEISDLMEKSSFSNEEFNNADYKFHSQIVACSHNAFLISAHDSFKDKILSALECMNLLDGSREYAIELHKRISSLLIKRDAKGAVSLYKNNGEYNLARMKEVFNKN